MIGQTISQENNTLVLVSGINDLGLYLIFSCLLYLAYVS